MTTAQGEALGDGTSGNEFAEMNFSIEKVTYLQRHVLENKYTLELNQDLKAIHGLDAESELYPHSTEVLAEINREVVRTIYPLHVLVHKTMWQPLVLSALTLTQTVVSPLKFGSPVPDRKRCKRNRS